VVSRTASTSRLTQGMPSASAPDRPQIRSSARSTETVVCVRAISMTGSAARSASILALRTTCGSSPSLGSCFMAFLQPGRLRANSGAASIMPPEMWASPPSGPIQRHRPGR
jgi:hypothetical protein